VTQILRSWKHDEIIQIKLFSAYFLEIPKVLIPMIRPKLKKNSFYVPIKIPIKKHNIKPISQTNTSKHINHRLATQIFVIAQQNPPEMINNAKP
jgi:hypothetical protein